MIILQFSTNDKIGARLIRWFTWSDYSHVDIVLPDGRLLGARGHGGVQIREHNCNMTYVRYAVDAPDTVIDYVLSQIGKPYDYAAIFGMPFRRDWQDTTKWFCSELILWAFKKAGYPLIRLARNGRGTPGDILKSILLIEGDYESC